MASSAPPLARHPREGREVRGADRVVIRDGDAIAHC